MGEVHRIVALIVNLCVWDSAHETALLASYSPLAIVHYHKARMTKMPWLVSWDPDHVTGKLTHQYGIVAELEFKLSVD